MNNTPNDYTISSEDMNDESGFSSPLLTFAAVLTFIIMIVGICGNFLTILALARCSKVRNVAAAFIISLCLADLLFCAMVLPFNAMRFIQGTWTHGEILCKLIPFIQYGNVGVSLLCIAMITINRYVMIAHHNSYGRIYKKHWIAVMIAFCWVFSYGMQLPTLFGVWGIFGYDAKLGTCSIMNDENGRSSKTSLFIIAFVIPCVIIIACYTKIFWVVHESEVRLKKHANKQNSIPNNLRAATVCNPENGQSQISSNVASDSSYSTKQETGAPAHTQKPSRIKDHREIRAKRNEWRITKMVLAIFLSFVICYLPITIMKVADKNVNYPSLHIFSYIMLYLSACINPIIYVIMNKQYRKAYKTILLCEPTRLLALVGKNGGGAGGSSSVAEMERYRVQQQPQPHNGLANVNPRSTEHQLEQHAISIADSFGNDDKTDHEKPLRRLESSDKEQQRGTGAASFTAESGLYDSRGANEHGHQQREQSTHPHFHRSEGQSHCFGGRRYYNGRRGGGDNIGPCSSRSLHREPEGTNICERRSSEEKPILWTKYKRHSR